MSVIPRRERIRAQTLQEIRELGARQVDEGGLAALSLNAIAKQMGMSGPALYRYFASRDELLAALITDGYAEITRTVEEAAAGGGDATARLTAVADAYRGWALAHPRRYALLFGERPEGFRDPEEAIAAIQGAMGVLLEIVAELAGDEPGEPDPELAGWVQRRGGAELPPRVPRLSLLLWTRMHGIVGLELSGAFGDMGVDAGALLEGEVAEVVVAAKG
jgi:AcrR family transcriptional regulator